MSLPSVDDIDDRFPYGSSVFHFVYEWRGVGLIAVFFLFRDRRILTLPYGFPMMMEYRTTDPALALLVPQMYSGR